MAATLKALTPKEEKKLQHLRDRGICEAEIETTLRCMRDGLSDGEIDLCLLRRAHGSLCSALIHLHMAGLHFAPRQREVFVLICRISADLSALVPNYEEFALKANKPRRRDTA